jgi:hypothetical protein
VRSSQRESLIDKKGRKLEEATRFVADRPMLKLLFGALDAAVSNIQQQEHSRQGTSSSAHPVPAVPPSASHVSEAAERSSSPLPSQLIVQWFNRLCADCDNFALDNVLGAVVTRSLLVEGDWIRALHVAGATPLLKGLARGRSEAQPNDEEGKPHETPEHRKLRVAERGAERRLVGMLYALHGRYGADAKRFTLLKYPFAFPKEVFDATSPAHELLNQTPELLERRHAAVASSSLSSTAALTERADVMMKDRVLRMEHNKHLMRYQRGDPSKDPIPAPLGLHDKANGWWNFNGRGGLPVYFSGGTKFAHLLSSHPKHMPDLRNAMRGWNPQQNSALAHRTNVRKWNGRSSV